MQKKMVEYSGTRYITPNVFLVVCLFLSEMGRQFTGVSDQRRLERPAADHVFRCDADTGLGH